MDKRSNETPFLVRAISAMFVLAMMVVALSGCTFVYDTPQDDSAVDDKVEQLSDSATDAIMGAFGLGEEATSSEELESLSELSKNGAVKVSSDDGEKLYEGTQAGDLVEKLSFESWEPVSAEVFDAEAGSASPSVVMVFSQDKTLLLGESQPSGRVDVAEISFWPNEGIAKLDIAVDDGEGVFLFDDIGISTKEGTSLLSLYFRIPDKAAKYVASL